MPGPLAEAFLSALPAAQRAAFAARADLDGAIAATIAAARAARPRIGGDDLDFAAYLAARLPDDAPTDRPIDAAVNAADLWLARACGRGDAGALALFEAEYRGVIDATLSRISSSSVRTEARQLLRWQLFVRGPEKTAKIEDYTGRGDLAGFVRVVVLRLALMELRKERPRDEGDDALVDLPAGDDPQLAHFKRLYRAEFAAAFTEGLAALEPRLRAVLRYQVVDGMTLDDIGTLYQVHRATVSRWAQRARDDLLAATRRALQARLRVGTDELESIVRLVQSQLDLSVHRLLAGDPDTDA